MKWSLNLTFESDPSETQAKFETIKEVNIASLQFLTRVTETVIPKIMDVASEDNRERRRMKPVKMLRDLINQLENRKDWTKLSFTDDQTSLSVTAKDEDKDSNLH